MEDDKIQQVADICNLSEQEAKSYLEASNGDIDVAVGLYYGGSTGSTSGQSETDDVHPESKSQASSGGPPPTNSQKPTLPKETNKGVTGFSDIKKVDTEEEKRNQFYAGGEKSGIAVLDPSKQNRDQLVDQVFETAQKHGAVSKSDVPVPDKEKFGGTGYTLGNNTSDQSKVVAPKPKPPGLKTVILTFWTDCFTVDDGPPRKFQDPANSAFLNDVHKGVVPRELEAMAKGADLNIELVKKAEEYKPPPKPKVVAFSGQGQSLGEINIIPVATKVNGSSILVDETKPITTIQVRCNDGSRLTIKCNHTHTIGDIKSHLEATKPSGKAMELRLSYPNKLLVDDNQNVQEAGLINASIIQRLF